MRVELSAALSKLTARFLNALHCVHDDRSQVELRHLLLHGAVLQAGQEEHSLDLPSHFAGFIHQGPERVLRRRWHLAERSLLEQRGVAADHGERCA